MKRFLVFVGTTVLTFAVLLFLVRVGMVVVNARAGTTATAQSRSSTTGLPKDCVSDGWFRAVDDGRVAQGTFENRCGRNVLIEYVLTGYTEANHVVIGPVKYTAYLKTNEAIPVYTVLNPSGSRFTHTDYRMVSVRAAVLQVRPS